MPGVRAILSIPVTPEEDAAFEELAERIAGKLAPKIAEALDERPLLKIEEVAERLKVSRTKVIELVRDGKIAHVRSDGQRRIEQRALDAYIDVCRAAAVDPPEEEGR